MVGPCVGEEFIRLVCWALDRLVKGQHKPSFNNIDNFASLNLDPSINHIDLEVAEESFKTTFSDEQCRALFSLKRARTPEQISKVLHLLFPSEIAQRGTGELEGADWDSIVLFVLLELAAAAERFGKDFADQQETFTTRQTRDVEKAMRISASEFFVQMSALKYVNEFGTSLPEVVGRARGLRMVTPRRNVPDGVQKYLFAASRCYIYGQFLASLVLCRSAIEYSVKDALRKVHVGQDADGIDDFSVAKLLRLARQRRVLDIPRWEQADNIRELARIAVHPKEGQDLPTEDQCRDAFVKTRDILDYLYE